MCSVGNFTSVIFELIYVEELIYDISVFCHIEASSLLGSLLLTRIYLFPTCISVGVVEITYPLPNINGVNVEAWEWINNPISDFMMGVIAYPW